ncbi:MAG: response regulator [Actinobacteria bacterium]|nr:response regulator [Actinomycetota bacterium]
MDRIRVLIAEDEGAVRDALVDLVSSDTSMEVVAAAADADQAIELAIETKPDVALIDVKMPGGGGPRAAKEIRVHSPQTHLVALSAYEDRSTVLQMLRAGVVGYIVKGTSADEILDTIRRSMRGQGSLSVEVTAEVIHELATLLERSEAMTRDLQELDRVKSELIQILSHELFTPITSIQGFAATVAAKGAELQPAEWQSLAASVTRASDRIRRLVGNLAASARLGRPGMEVPTDPVEVKDLLAVVLSEFKQQDSRLVQRAKKGALDARIWADMDLATRALVIVVENALALSPTDSQVEIEVSDQNSSVAISILDRGPGMTEETRRRIFDAFTQADASTSREHQGLGIGLYLAQRIMAAHAGSIEIASRVGGGSILSLTFPSYAGGTR